MEVRLYFSLSLCECVNREEKRAKSPKNVNIPLDLSMSSLRRGHANLLCIVPI